MKNKHLIYTKFLIFNLLFLIFSTTHSYGGIIATKHNLSMYGPGPVKALSTTEICIFCHTPHNSSPDFPLWNREDPGENYDLYGSPTVIATIGQPTGGSRLCLSCHDGTIAIGSLLNLPGAGIGGPGTLEMEGVTAEGRCYISLHR